MLFDDLIYLNQFIRSEKDQKILRQFTRKNMTVDQADDDKGYNLLLTQADYKKMDMNEFLGHVNEHLKLNLDQIFLSNLSDIMFFF